MKHLMPNGIQGFVPGPTQIPLAVQKAMYGDQSYHRSEGFAKTLLSSRKLLQALFGGEFAPLILTSSGTGAMEAAVRNFVSPGDPVVVNVSGKFSLRWAQLCQTYGAELVSMETKWGEAASPDQMKAFLAQLPFKEARAVFLTAHESSTGALFDIEALSRVIRTRFPNTLIVVDAVSSLVAHRFHQKNWDVDVVVSGSQKGLGLPSGLAFVSLSSRALSNFGQGPTFYFNLKKEWVQQEKGSTSFTPAIQNIIGLKASLDLIHSLGLPELAEHHALLAICVRASIEALGLKILPQKCPSSVLTAVICPDGLRAEDIVKTMQNKYGIQVAGGQDQVKGKIFRISHLGFMNVFDPLSCIAALELTLKDLGFAINLGAGVSAYLKAYGKFAHC